MRKIANFLKYNRSKELGKCKFTMRDLIEWCEKYKKIPNSDHEVYVTNYKYETTPEREFRLFITTKNLIQFTAHVCSN